MAEGGDAEAEFNPDTIYQGHLEFRIATGNAGTGCAGEVQSEHGCEFAPVAGQVKKYIEIPSAPYSPYVISVFDEKADTLKTFLRNSRITQKQFRHNLKQRANSKGL